MRVTIETVAKRAGVATSTVSLVLRNRPRVAEKTRRAVLAAVKQLGYEKSSPGRPRKQEGEPVSAKRTRRIALLVPGLSPSTLYSPVYLDVLAGVEEAIQEARMIMVLHHVRTEGVRKPRVLPTRVDGALVLGDVDDSRVAESLSALPVVQMMHAVLPVDRWDRVTYDNEKVGALAARYMLERGHRHCAFIGRICSRSEYFLQERGLTFRRAMEAGVARVTMMIREFMHVTEQAHAIRSEAVEAIAAEIAASRPRPSAVFVEADMLAAALYPALRLNGLTPGLDIEVVSCNNEIPLLANLQPRPATIDIHARQVGRQAVQRLLWRIANPSAPAKPSLVQPSLVPPAPA